MFFYTLDGLINQLTKVTSVPLCVLFPLSYANFMQANFPGPNLEHAKIH